MAVLFATERGTDCLQINFGLAGAGHAVEQNRVRLFRGIERLCDLLKRMRLLLVESEVRRCDELFVSMWIPHDCFFAQLHEAAFLQRTKRLVVERGLPQKLRRAGWRFQSQDRLQKFCLSGRASSQLLKFFIVDLAPAPGRTIAFSIRFPRAG